MIQNDRRIYDSEGRILVRPLIPLAAVDAPLRKATLTGLFVPGRPRLTSTQYAYIGDRREES